jgi:hypothetical protein
MPEALRLPKLLNSKIYKTGQTRGADDDVIYQNRVLRNSTVLIPYSYWANPFPYPQGESNFSNGCILLIPPVVYFERNDINTELMQRNLQLGRDCIVFYETRYDWEKYNPDRLKWSAAESRRPPLGGNYIARVPATTAAVGGHNINRGFTTSSNKGAGIRLYEYASTNTITSCRLQLEALYWLCDDAIDAAVAGGMARANAVLRQQTTMLSCSQSGLLDYARLNKARLINGDNKTICPLCIEELSGNGFFNRMVQAEGRGVPDLTVTEINLFHIEELRYGVYNHKPYNVGWGHHHCNVVTRDVGIIPTLAWMEGIIEKNKKMIESDAKKEGLGTGLT